MNQWTRFSCSTDERERERERARHVLAGGKDI
jgi:hypothetical protein